MWGVYFDGKSQEHLKRLYKALHPEGQARKNGCYKFCNHLFKAIKEYGNGTKQAYNHICALARNADCEYCDDDNILCCMGIISFRRSQMEIVYGKFPKEKYHYEYVFVGIIKEIKEGYPSYDEIRGITRYVYFYCYIHW